GLPPPVAGEQVPGAQLAVSPGNSLPGDATCTKPPDGNSRSAVPVATLKLPAQAPKRQCDVSKHAILIAESTPPSLTQASIEKKGPQSWRRLHICTCTPSTRCSTG